MSGQVQLFPKRRYALTLCFCIEFHVHTHTDINECEEPTLAALCADNAECCNLPGHFVCKCKPGFTGNATDSCTGKSP